MRKPILYSTIKSIIDKYYSGYSIEELVKTYGVAKNKILYNYLRMPYALQTYGRRIHVRKSKLTPEQRKKIIDMFVLGHHRNDIAREFNVTNTTISDVVKKHKEQRRGRVRMIEANRDVLIKYSKPTKLCHAPYGTSWLHLSEETQEDLYIQVGKDMMQPDWRPIGYVLQKAFEHKVSEEVFILECLELYESNITHSIQE